MFSLFPAFLAIKLKKIQGFTSVNRNITSALTLLIHNFILNVTEILIFILKKTNKLTSIFLIQVEKRSVGQQPPTAPSTFKLVPVRTEQEKPPPPVAPPAGPSNLKPSLDQIDRQVLHTVDDHAIQVY